ncbi:MAG: type II 3-dehydroquinate dehydratase [Desulfosalsimonadaceae bacterium]
MNSKILVIHGPNLNMLGTREPAVYGSRTLACINGQIVDLASELGMSAETMQSNYEGEIVSCIQKAAGSVRGLIINPAAYTHTSIAIRDAVLMLDVPVIEIHLSNIHKREAFRRRSLLSDVATGQIAGFGADGYILAVRAMAELLKQSTAGG